MLYIVNINFDGNLAGEILEAEPMLVEDWEQSGFISRVDERGDRIVTPPKHSSGNGVQPDRVVGVE